MIWRGPMVMGAIRQFLKDVLWGTLDFLIVDLPPGTGDAQLTLAQQVALDGAVIVTTPQDVAVADALRAVRMLRQVHCPLLGVVENMSYFACPDCGERDEIFGHGGGEKMAADEQMEVLARVPLFVEVRGGGDEGMPIARQAGASGEPGFHRTGAAGGRGDAANLITLLEIPDGHADYRRMYQLRRMCPAMSQQRDLCGRRAVGIEWRESRRDRSRTSIT